MANLPARRGKNAVSTVTDVGALVAQWHEALALEVGAGERSAITAESYRRGMARFLTWAEANAGGKTGAQAIRSWLADLKAQGYKANSIQAWYAGLRAFYAWGVAEGILHTDPTQGVKGAKRVNTNRQHLRDPLTDTEVRRTLAIYGTDSPEARRNRAILYLLAYGALREIEIVRARREDLRTKDGRLVLYLQGKGETETGTEMTVLCDPGEEAAMYDWLAVRGPGDGPLFPSLSDRNRGQAMTTRAIRAIVKDAMRQAGIDDPRKTGHSLRHSAASSIIRNGGTVRDVQVALRHASVDTSMIYVHEANRTENPPERFVRYDGTGK